MELLTCDQKISWQKTMIQLQKVNFSNNKNNLLHFKLDVQ